MTQQIKNNWAHATAPGRANAATDNFTALAVAGNAGAEIIPVKK